MNALRSRKYLDGARGETCKLRIPGVCNNDSETVVACHIRDRHTGRSIKASDISIVDACSACHDAFDGRSRALLGLDRGVDWYFYALRGLQETLENRIARGILPWPADAEPKPKSPKPRKPKAQRAPIPSRKLQSRGFDRREK
jgi:ribosomal protein L31